MAKTFDANDPNLVLSRLRRMKEIAHDAEKEAIKLQERLDGLMLTLKESFDCDTVEQASKKLTTTKNAIGTAWKGLERDIANLEESYDWSDQQDR